MPDIPASLLAEVLDERFSPPASSQEYAILQAFKALHSESTRHVALVDSEDYENFPLVSFLEARKINFDIPHNPRHELVSWVPLAADGTELDDLPPWRYYEGMTKTAKGKLAAKLNAGAMKFTYEGTEFVVYKISWHHQAMYYGSNRSLYDIVFEGPLAACIALTSAGHKLVSDVYKWAGALKNELWVYYEGRWSKDREMWNSVQSASWDNVCLQPEFLKGLRRDIHTFFANQKIYQGLDIVWKRGILLYGPPGNGKTESIKVLLKEAGMSALYVKSFKSDKGPEFGVQEIYDHARSNSPCILVIEDLDSLLTNTVRSYFLNELDGIGRNEGILTIASTNHPELIDDAILNRPSRFDVKYNFALPDIDLRRVYAMRWLKKINNLAPENKPIVEFGRSESELAEEIAKRTSEWSFAFLKELFMSFLLRIAHEQSRVENQGVKSESTLAFCDDVLFDQIVQLQKQILEMKKQSAKPDSPTTSDESSTLFDFSSFFGFFRSLAEAFAP